MSLRGSKATEAISRNSRLGNSRLSNSILGILELFVMRSPEGVGGMTKKAKWGNDTRLRNSRLFVMRSKERIAKQKERMRSKNRNSRLGILEFLDFLGEF